mgnify:CR=1 FL=1
MIYQTHFTIPEIPWKRESEGMETETTLENSARPRLEELLERMNRKESDEVNPMLIWIFLKELIRILLVKMEGRS